MPMGGLYLPEALLDQMADTFRVTLMKVDDSEKLAGLGSALIVGVAAACRRPRPLRRPSFLFWCVRAVGAVLLRREGYHGQMCTPPPPHPTKDKKKPLKVGFGAPPTSDSDDDGWDV